MITRQTVKGCCGNSLNYFQLDRPIRKKHAEAFRALKYSLPEHFNQAGVFYAMRDRVIINGGYGTSRFSVRCSGPDCDKKLDQLEADIREILK